MKTLTLPTPRNASEAAVQARIFERALNLFDEGYTYVWGFSMFPELEYQKNVFVVTTPEGNHYAVDIDAQKCECKCFEDKGYCKHYLAIEKMLQDCEQLELQFGDY